MTNEPTFHRVSKSMNRPLTIWGAERRLFFLAAIMGAATFNFFASLVSGILMFFALYAFARWATARDTQMLRVLLNSSRFRTHYDPFRRAVFMIERRSGHGTAR